MDLAPARRTWHLQPSFSVILWLFPSNFALISKSRNSGNGFSPMGIFCSPQHVPGIPVQHNWGHRIREAGMENEACWKWDKRCNLCRVLFQGCSLFCVLKIEFSSKSQQIENFSKVCDLFQDPNPKDVLGSCDDLTCTGFSGTGNFSSPALLFFFSPII